MKVTYDVNVLAKGAYAILTVNEGKNSLLVLKKFFFVAAFVDLWHLLVIFDEKASQSVILCKWECAEINLLQVVVSAPLDRVKLFEDAGLLQGNQSNVAYPL